MVCTLTLNGILSSGYAEQAAPTVTLVSPSSGTRAGGTAVIITGTGFLSGVGVKFDGKPCTGLVRKSSTSITCTTPLHSAGEVSVTAKNRNGTTGSLSSGYTYQAAPTVTLVTASSGATAGGTAVTITGTGFLSGVGVKFDGKPCTGLVQKSSTSITCTTPAHSAGAVTVTARNSDTQSGSLSSGYTYQAAPTPTVTSIVASSGTTVGGTSVTITGTGFLIGVGVTIGGSAATVTSLNSSTFITATTPPGTVGAKDVVVTNSDTQFGTLSGGYTYVNPLNTWSQEAYLKASNAEALDLYGSSVSISGDTIVVGADYEDSNQTTITNGTTSSADNSAGSSGAAYVYKRSGTTWSQEAYLKASNAEAYDRYGCSVSLSGDTLVVGAYSENSNQTTITNGTTSSANNSAGGSGAAYVYKRTQATGTPSVSSLSPSSGAAAGDNIIIFGANFYSGAVASVDGVNCTTTTVQGPNEIICTLPTEPSTGALTVTVTNSDATSGSLANAYPYEPTVCAIYTVRAENIIAACSELISQNSEGLREVAPNCESSFLAITPRVGCPLLVSQLNNAIGATGCGIVFTIHRSYLTPACAEAYDQLVKP